MLPVVPVAMLGKVGTGTVRYILATRLRFLKPVRQVSTDISVYLAARPPARFVAAHPKPESPYAAPDLIPGCSLYPFLATHP